MKDLIKYVAVIISITLITWGVGTLFADGVSNYKIINPKDGIECVVVSRMFNTSVDCWKLDNE